MARDDFSKPTKLLLAERAGHHCSRCDVSTLGPAGDEQKRVSIGDAAHISGAAPNGPRYNPSLTPEQRSHYDNGIWLCMPCARIVDHDESTYSIEDLRRLKQSAVARAGARLGKPHDGAPSTQVNAAVVLGPNAISISGSGAVVIGPGGISIHGPTITNH